MFNINFRENFNPHVANTGETIKFTNYGPDSMMKRKLGKKYRRKLNYDEEQIV